MPPYVTRDQWGARSPKYRNVMPRPVSLVVIHHSVTNPAANPHSTMRGIQDFHMGPTKNWSDIAYQECVSMAPEYDGWVFEGRGFGYIGGATGTPPGDANSLSICLLGNAEDIPPTTAAIESIAQRLAYAEKVGRLAPGWKLTGDRTWNQTACPGKFLFDLLPAIRARAAAIVADNEPTPAPPTDPAPDPEDDDMRWLYYHDESNGTEFVVTSSGQVRKFGPEALRQLRIADVIPTVPVKIPHDVAEQFFVGGK